MELDPKYLTPRWNNLLSLVLGIPAAAFVVVAYSTGLWSQLGGLIGMGLIGVFY